jgi:hypothetical protein
MAQWRAEMDAERQSRVGESSAAIAGEEGMGFSYGPRQREDKGARGGARGRRPWWRSGHQHMAEQLPRARGQWPGGRLNGVWHWEVVPILFLIFQDFQAPKLWNSKWWLFDVQIFQVSFLKYKEQLFFLDQLQNHKGLQVINFGINSNSNLPWNLKRFKPFCKNLINFLNFHPQMIYLNMNLHWLTCIQKLEVPIQVGKMS